MKGLLLVEVTNENREGGAFVIVIDFTEDEAEPERRGIRGSHKS